MVNVTWSPTDKGTGVVLTNNNLTAMIPNHNNTVRASLGRSTGKWYWEVLYVSYTGAVSANLIGIANSLAALNSTNFSSSNFKGYYINGNKTPENVAYGAAYTVNDTIGIALDLDNGTLGFYKNGVYQGISHTNIKMMGVVYPALSNGGSSFPTTSTANFGATLFEYDIPKGYKSYDENQSNLISNKILILTENSTYQKWDNGWQTVSTTNPTEQDYIDSGMEALDVEAIPESAWQELQGVVSLSYFTDDPSIEEITIETETEPYSIYDEFGDSMEVLYYTDDPDKEESELEITANYSPLDEIEGDFEVVTWTDALEEVDENNPTELGKILNMNALPSPQFIKQVNPNDIHGTVNNFLSEEVYTGTENGVIRYLLSPNKTTWKTWNKTNFVNIDIVPMSNIVNEGMTRETIEALSESDWGNWTDETMYLGIYLEEDIRDKTKSQIDSISYKNLTPRESTQISDARLYILNTISTIDVTFSGNTLTGSIDDEDEGKVQYRILLNGQSYFPVDGSFTPLMASPLDISTTLSSDDVLIDENNTLRIEFKDYWGTIDYWETNFEGTYSGLLFLDQSGQYYSTDIGEVLQYLDFGILIAGQTTIEQAIVLRNTYGYTVENINIRANQSEFPSGMKAQFGTNDISFEALDELNLEDQMSDGDEKSFYIRLTSQLGVTPEANGEFDIIVTADKVE